MTCLTLCQQSCQLMTLFDLDHGIFDCAERVVAERILYFCLARNLIQLLGSTHNFTLSG